MVIIFTLYSRQNNGDLTNIKLINISIMFFFFLLSFIIISYYNIFVLNYVLYYHR